MTAGLRRLVLVALFASAGWAVAASDDYSVQVDPHANFAVFKTFAQGDGKMQSARPELDNPLFMKRLGRAIHDAMIAQGFKEDIAKPDLRVTFSMKGEEVNTTQRGMGAGPVPVRYSIGTLQIEATRPGETSPVWRGIYKDDESTGSKLVVKLPEDAKKLIEKFPRK